MERTGSSDNPGNAQDHDKVGDKAPDNVRNKALGEMREAAFSPGTKSNIERGGREPGSESAKPLDSKQDKQLVAQGFPELMVALMKDKPLAAASEDGKKEEKKPTALEKEINQLIERMGYDIGDNSFQVREAAQKKLVNLGSAAFVALDTAEKLHEDPEIRQRAAQAKQELLAKPPAVLGKLEAINAFHTGALREIAEKGKMSDEIHNRYKKLIGDTEGLIITRYELEMRMKPLNEKLEDNKAPTEDRIEAFRQVNKLEVIQEVRPEEQVLLDYAEALIKSGDKAAAKTVLLEAFKKDPELKKSATFRVLAVDADAIKDERFKDEVDASIDRTSTKDSLNTISHWTNKGLTRIRFLGHKMVRFGATEGIIEEWQNILDNHLKLVKKETDPEAIRDTLQHRAIVQRYFVDRLTHCGNSTQATKIMTQMLREDGALWVNSDWMKSMAELNKSHENKDFKNAMEAARKKVDQK